MQPQRAQSDSLMGRRIAVTGAQGFLGRQLVQSLSDANAEVLALDTRSHHESTAANTPLVQSQQLDLGYLGALQDCLEEFRPDTLYHLASAPDGEESFSQVQLSIDNTLQLTVNTLEAFRRAGGNLLIYGDSSKSYGNVAGPFHSQLTDQPLSSYAIAKSAGWQFCKYYARLHGLEVISVRPTLIYGPTQGHNLINYVVESVLAEKKIITIDGGEQTRDPLYIDDAIRAFLEVARQGSALAGKVINIGGGREISVKAIAELVLQIMEQPNVRIASDSSNRRTTECDRNFCENNEAHQILGWRPQVSLEMGLQESISRLLAAEI